MGRFLCSLLLACSLLTVGQIIRAADGTTLSIDGYFELTKARLELAEKEWQERVTSANEANGDRAVLLARSAAITKQYAASQSELHSQFGVTPQTFLAFGSDHAQEVASYLEENTDVERDLSAVRQRIQILMDQFDAIAQPMLAQGEPQ
jgi:hypothetical protein